MSKLPEEDDELGLGIVIGAEYSEPIKLSPAVSLAPTKTLHLPTKNSPMMIMIVPYY
jgi:hypothetical protein